MDAYDFYKTLHVLLVIIWVGGGVTLQVLATRMRGADDPARMAAFGADIEFVGKRIFTPAAILVLITGILMVVDGPWAFSDPWIAIGLVGYLITMLTGMLFLGPQSGKVGAMTAEKGPADPEVKRLTDRLYMVARVDLVVLLVVVVDMVVKPQ